MRSSGIQVRRSWKINLGSRLLDRSAGLFLLTITRPVEGEPCCSIHTGYMAHDDVLQTDPPQMRADDTGS